MANYIDKLRDKLNNYIFPITLTKAVYKENTSTTLDDLLIDKLDTSTYTASDVLAKLKTVDGAGSGIDADTVDGKHYSDIVNYMDSGIDNVEVGGRNYFSNSDFREGMNVYWQLLNSSPSSNFEISGGELKVTFNAGTKSDFGTMNFLSQNNLEGQDYITVSSLIRGNGTLRIRFGASTMPMQTINNEQFKRVIFTIPRSNFGNGNLIIEVASGTLYFYKIKAETGNKATDWAPSPEEVEGLIDSKVDKSQVLTNVPSGAKFSDTIYTHPSTHPSSMITQDATHRFTTDVEKTTWNAKETPSGAQLKANIAEENAKTYTDETIPTKVSQLTNDSNYITQSELGSVGYGDMLKSIYDTNGDGIVDNAEKLNGHTVSEFAFVNTQNIYNGEQKFQNSSYCPTAMDNASGVECAYKASRGAVNQEIVGQIIAPRTAASDSNYSISNAANVIKFQRISSASAAAPTLADMGKVTSKGWEGGAVLSGTPTAPTASVGTNNTQIATTAFVQNAVSSSSGGTTIVVSASQPSSQATNDMWFAVV